MISLFPKRRRATDKWIGLAAGGAILAGSVSEPGAVLGCALATVVLGPQLLKLGAAASVRCRRGFRPFPDGKALNEPRGKEELPFVSIHVATHDEPPGIVIATLRALARLDYPEGLFEVIILDNNTPNPEVWRPVARWCEARKSVFRFHHYDGVRGAKAGALNIALSLTDRRATVVASVDADYQVDPGFLRMGVAPLEDASVTHVQFPQAYRRVNGGQRGVEAELEQYFTCYAEASRGSNAMLLTGTLSLVRRQALEEVGGWPWATITEDAHLGSRLLQIGGKGIYLAGRAGAGLLPGDFQGLSRQRFRWVAGNVQTLRRLLRDRPRAAVRLPWQTRATMAYQLLAWSSFLLLPLGLLVGLLAMGSTVNLSSVWMESAAAILLMAVALEASTVLLTVGGTIRRRLEAVAVRIALLPESAWGTVTGLFADRLRFLRTPKVAGAISHPERGRMVGCLVAVLLGAFALSRGFAWAGLAWSLVALVPLLRAWLSRSMVRQSESWSRDWHSAPPVPPSIGLGRPVPVSWHARMMAPRRPAPVPARQFLK